MGGIAALANTETRFQNGVSSLYIAAVLFVYLPADISRHTLSLLSSFGSFNALLLCRFIEIPQHRIAHGRNLHRDHLPTLPPLHPCVRVMEAKDRAVRVLLLKMAGHDRHLP